MSETLRVQRGGSWLDDGAADLAARARLGYAPSYRFYDFGFRCARVENVHSSRVGRGGSWYDDAAYVRAGVRFVVSPDDQYGGLGFRMVRRKG